MKLQAVNSIPVVSKFCMETDAFLVIPRNRNNFNSLQPVPDT